MNEYLRIEQERVARERATNLLPATDEQNNPYLQAERERQRVQQNQARTVIETALRDDPELAAERRRLSQTSGLAPDVVQRNLEELRVKEQARAVDLVRMAQDSPILYRQLVDPNFTTTAIDDLGTLGNLEHLVGRNVHRAIRYATGRDGLARDVGRGAVDVGLGATAGVGEMVFNVAGTLYDLVGWRSGAQSIRGMANRSKEARDALGFQPEGITGQAVKSGLQSSGTSLAILPLGLARNLFTTANQAASAVAGILSAGVGADAYLRSREKDRTQFESLRYAIPEAVFEFVFERIPASKLFGDIAANTGLLKLLGRQAISEGWTEQLTTLSQDFNEWMNLNPDKTLGEFINERPVAAYQTFIATLVGVGVQTSTIKGINKIIERASDQSLTFERDLLQQQMQLAAASMLRTRSPEQFRAHIQRVVDANESATSEIFVDAEVLNQLPQELLAQLPESVRAALPDALDTNSTVAIPMADVLTIAPGTELEQILNDNARMRPNAASRVEGELAAKMIEEDAARVLAQAADTAAWQQGTQTVQQTILGELNTAGRFTPDVNEAYATLQANFFSTMAARVGMTPEALYERYRLRVAARQPGGGGQVLNTGQTLRTVKAGDVVDGRVVREGVPNLDAIGASLDNFEVLPGVREVPMSAFDPEYVGGISMDRLDERTRALAEEIRASNEITPLIVVQDADGMYVLEGGHRLDALIASGAQSLPAVVVVDQDNAPGQVLNQSATIRRGKETLKKFGLTPGKKYKTREVAAALEARQRKKYGTIAADDRSPEALANIARWMQAEVEFAMDNPESSGVGWYSEKFQRALDKMAQTFPELATDKVARNTMTALIAITSDGQKVVPNFAQAMDIYGRFRPGGVTEGRFTTSRGHARQESIAGNLEVIQRLHDQMGAEAMHVYLMQEKTISELKKIAKDNGGEIKSDYQAHIKMPMAAVEFGPKLGAFYANLMGAHGYLTMDRWWSRTFNRYRGLLLTAPTKKALDSFKALIGQPEITDDQVLSAVVEPRNAYEVRGFKTALALVMGKSEPSKDADKAKWMAGVRVLDSRAALDAALEKAAQGLEKKTKKGRTKVVEDEDGNEIRVPLPDNEAQKIAADLRRRIGTATVDELLQEHRVERAANTIYKDAFEKLEDAPFNATDRTFMLDAVNRAQKSLARKGYNLSVADIQAILWYYEKRLYGELGARQTADISYEEAAQRVVAGYASGSGIESLLDDAGATPEDGGADAQRVPVGEEQFVADAGTDTGSVLNQGDVDARPQQAGDRGGRYSSGGFAPLEGAPDVSGATGPDPRIVAVAEQYARDNGVPLRRQAEYASVDPGLAQRIAAAYDEMQHAPDDPAVREAYQNLIQQTLAQYRALEAAGYRFYLFDESNDPYDGNPWNAMRDLRATQTMGVFSTAAGFGSDESTTGRTGNPMEADTGLMWPYGSPDGELRPVLANDLFRAVHDAFGHGLEGAGFREQGEENAWQAHARLYTGTAVGAITSETRGQNSWLNFGPYGETNRTASVEDTVFADQKTGLMPEWTWTEGRVGDAPDVLKQEQQPAQPGPRGTYNPETLLITLGETADLSTFLHESGHFFLEVLADLASQPNAPAGIAADMASTLKWFGVKDLATWNAMTLDQKRPYHEKWAESFEQYLFEGKAPTPELQPLFRRFRSWMLNVYKSLSQFMRGRNLQVNDEVRQVFGRLLATDEQIAQAEEAAGMLPDFEATNEAIEALQARSLRDLKWTVRARGRALKALEKQAADLRKGVEAEVRAEVGQEPVYRAIRWLRTGEMTDEEGTLVKAEKGFRLNTDAIAEMYPESMLARPDLTGLKGMTSKTGLSPDLVADMFGYPSGDALVRAVLAAEPMGSVIEGITDQRMLERHGELATPEALEAAANEAVHNEARARSLATELKSQTEMMNERRDTGRTDARGRPITVNAVVEAAKQFGQNLAARRRINELKSAAWQHRSAEARAGKRWQEATAKGETEAAVQAKRDQVLNNAAAKALQEAQAEVAKIAEFFKRVTTGNNEKLVKGGRDPDVVNAMRAILAAYGVAPRLEKSALEYMEVVSRNDPAMYAALKPSVDGAMMAARPLTELTMEELRGLNDELRAMWQLAKRSRQMEVDGNLLDLEDAANDLVARMDEIGIPAEIPGEKGAITDSQERGIKLRFALSILTRVEQWAERLDGKYGGPFLRLVFQPIKDAADRFRTDRVDYRKRYEALLKGVAPYLPRGAIAAPELRYTFGNARDSGAAELLHAILHTGNDSNKRKLLLGRGWATENADGTLDTTAWDTFLQRMAAEGKLVKQHYDFAQGVWDMLEQMKPLAQETHRQVYGRYFAEVTANEVVTPFGTYRGGYVPAQTDSRLVKDAKLRELAEGENESMAYAFPASPSGFTKSRVEYNKPLMLDLRTLAQHMDKVLLFAHMQGAVTDVRRLLTNKSVSYALDRIDPGAYEGMLIPWLNRAARQVVETPTAGDRKLSRFLSAARSRAGMALMFANLSNTAQQIAGFSLAAVKVKPGLMMKATAQFIADPKAMKTTVAEASPYMKDRMLNEISAMNDAVEQILLDPTMLERGQAWTQRHAYFLQAAVDNTMSPIIWTAAYNQAIAKGETERDAVRFADGTVRQTQGSTLPEDISRFESGPAYGRLFTQFVSYFNMMANTNATAISQIANEMGLRKGAGKVLYVALAGLLIPIWVAEAIAHAFRGGPEDEDDDGYLDDWLMAVFGLGTIRGLVAQVPIVGQGAQLVVNRFNDNPADDKFSLSPAVSLIESTVSAPSSVYKAIVEDGNKQKAVRDVAAAATMITGLPIFALGRPLGYIAGMADDRIEPTGPADMIRGLVTGTASPESKVP